MPQLPWTSLRRGEPQSITELLGRVPREPRRAQVVDLVGDEQGGNGARDGGQEIAKAGLVHQDVGDYRDLDVRLPEFERMDRLVEAGDPLLLAEVCERKRRDAE